MTTVAARKLDEAGRVAARLPPLLIQAMKVAATVAPGIHGRRRPGPGHAFWQYRDYDPADPATAVDWRQSAKRDRVFVREREWSTAHTLWLWADRSASMNWHSEKPLPTKKARAELILLALADMALRGGERLAILGDPRRPVASRLGLEALAVRLLAAPPAATSLPPLQRLPPRARLILVGDFLDPLPELEKRLTTLAAAGAKAELVQVIDPAEEVFPFRGRTRFLGVEGEPSLLVPKADSLRQAYIARLAAQRDGLRLIARKLGWGLAIHHTNHPPESLLLSLWRRYAERQE